MSKLSKIIKVTQPIMVQERWNLTSFILMMINAMVLFAAQDPLYFRIEPMDGVYFLWWHVGGTQKAGGRAVDRMTFWMKGLR